MTEITTSHRQSFESIRHEEDGVEFWLARQLAPLLGYQDYRNFLAVIDKARVAATGVGLSPSDHFGDVTKMVDLGSGAQRQITDVRLEAVRQLSQSNPARHASTVRVTESSKGGRNWNSPGATAKSCTR